MRRPRPCARPSSSSSPARRRRSSRTRNERVEVVRREVIVESAPAEEPLPDVIRRAALDPHRLRPGEQEGLPGTPGAHEPRAGAGRVRHEDPEPPRPSATRRSAPISLGVDPRTDLLPGLVVNATVAAVELRLEAPGPMARPEATCASWWSARSTSSTTACARRSASRPRAVTRTRRRRLRAAATPGGSLCGSARTLGRSLR